MAEVKDGIKTFYARSGKAWRIWLEKNHQKEKSVWLIIYKKESKVPSVYYHEAVDHALCYGWIDSKPNKRDDESYYQFFAKRNPKSKWSKVNKAKVHRLMEEGLMQPAGLAMVELAKANGTWDALNLVEDIVLPEDLQRELNHDKRALQNWTNFSRSSKRGILEWILNAKRADTRQKRISETVRLAAMNVKANHPTG
jgi:uncharacterized protein YdeI (YjbR/CyaY-like superfamily)